MAFYYYIRTFVLAVIIANTKLARKKHANLWKVFTPQNIRHSVVSADIWKRPGFTKLCTEAHPQRIAQLYFALMIGYHWWYLFFFSPSEILSYRLIYFLSVPPEIIDAESSTSTVNIRENYNASLICKATGTPEPEITWKREDGRKIVIKRKKNNGKKGNQSQIVTL